jgi:GH43 family beta-xylosidase
LVEQSRAGEGGLRRSKGGGTSHKGGDDGKFGLCMWEDKTIEIRENSGVTIKDIVDPTSIKLPPLRRSRPRLFHHRINITVDDSRDKETGNKVVLTGAILDCAL